MSWATVTSVHAKLNWTLETSFHLTLMAVLRALLVPDILILILQEIKHDKSALASVAFTCRSLSPMALDFLWKELETSTPMKRLLPILWNADGTYVS
jgi:hypothetical protein